MRVRWTVTAAALFSACSWDWDTFDPRLGAELASPGGAGGVAAASGNGANASASSVASGGAAGGPTMGYRQTVLADGPVGYWRFGEAQSATMALDESASGYTGVYVGGVVLGVPGALAGDPDSAARFDGVDDQVAFGDVLDFPGMLPFSVEAWITPEVGPASPGTICAKQVNYEDGFQFGLDVSTVRVFLNRETGMTGESVSAPVPLGQFSHVVGTFDGSSLRMYVNAIELDMAASLLVLPDNQAQLLAGNSEPAGEYWTGVIDELAIYDKALSPARIAAHYGAGTAP